MIENQSKTSENELAETAIFELLELSKENITATSRIEWWLLKHEHAFETWKDQWLCKFHIEEDEFECACGEKPHTHIFIELYERLNRVCEMRRHEARYAHEIEQYLSRKGNDEQLQKWEHDLEDWTAYNCPLIEYSGINYMDETPSLTVYNYPTRNISVQISKDEFPDAIRFHQIWTKVYWDCKK